jgi:hypothetical protein
MTAMDITIHRALLSHDDPDASLASCRDALGFEVRNDVEFGGMHWITVGPPISPARPSSCTRRPPPPSSPTTSAAPSEMTAKGTYASINLATTDLDGTFERLQAGDNLIRIQELD